MEGLDAGFVQARDEACACVCVCQMGRCGKCIFLCSPYQTVRVWKLEAMARDALSRFPRTSLVLVNGISQSLGQGGEVCWSCFLQHWNTGVECQVKQDTIPVSTVDLALLGFFSCYTCIFGFKCLMPSPWIHYKCDCFIYCAHIHSDIVVLCNDVLVVWGRVNHWNAG